MGADPYRAYRPYAARTASHLPIAGATSARVPAAAPDTSASWTGSSLQTAHHYGPAMFHDGNAGHLWRGEVAAQLGEAVINTGAIIWLAFLTASPRAILLGVLMLGAPWLLAGPLAIPLQHVRDPGAALKWLGRTRALLALGLIPMHYHTILPVVFLLLFGIALCGRLRSGARVAAMRACLAPGEPELVANDLHVGTALAAVIGPLLASALFVVIGERILLVSAGGAALFFLSANSESFLDALPPTRRAYLRAMPEAGLHRAERDDDDDDDDDASESPASEWRRERALPAWDSEGPGTVHDGVRDIGDGLGIINAAGTRAGLYALALLAVIGGGFSVVAVLYAVFSLQFPSFYLGPLFGAEAAGVALGVALASPLLARGGPRLWLTSGLVGAGMGLWMLALLPRLPMLLVAALVWGLCTALASLAARQLLTAHATGPEVRAIAAAEATVTALCCMLGAPLFVLFYSGVGVVPHAAALGRFFPGWPANELLLGMGVTLAAGGLLCGLMTGARHEPRHGSVGKRVPDRGATRDSGDEARDSAALPMTGDWDDEPDRYAESGQWSAADDDDDDDDEYGDSHYGPTTSSADERLRDDRYHDDRFRNERYPDDDGDDDTGSYAPRGRPRR